MGESDFLVCDSDASSGGACGDCCGTSSLALDAELSNLELYQDDPGDGLQCLYGCRNLNPSDDSSEPDLSQLDCTDPNPENWTASDDVKHCPLPPVLVKGARQKELKYLKDMEVYHAVSRKLAIAAGKRVLKLKWIDTNKGDRANPLVRSRLVCTEVRRKGIEAVFAATPPLDSLKTLCVKAAGKLVN